MQAYPYQNLSLDDRYGFQKHQSHGTRSVQTMGWLQMEIYQQNKQWQHNLNKY
jgi:hypothetical protein